MKKNSRFIYYLLLVTLMPLITQCGSSQSIGFSSNIKCADITDKEDKKKCLEKLRIQVQEEDSSEDIKVNSPGRMEYAEHSQKVAELGKLDILFVIDNSGSMADEQRNIANQFDSFLNTIKNQNYQIAIISTDSSENGRFRTFGNNKKVLSSNDSHRQNISLFQQTIRLGVSGSHVEKALLTSTMAIKRAENQRLFFREDSLLAIIIVSDELPNNSSTTPSDVFTAIKNLNKNIAVMVSSIILPAHNRPHNTYVQATVLNNNLKTQFGNIKPGYIGNIAQNDYGAQLGPIANLAISNIPITLPCVPKAPTVAVFINGREVNKDYISLSEKLALINLEEPISKGSQVDIRYVCK